MIRLLTLAKTSSSSRLSISNILLRATQNKISIPTTISSSTGAITTTIPNQTAFIRFYSATRPALEDNKDGGDGGNDDDEEEVDDESAIEQRKKEEEKRQKLILKAASREYGNKKAAYKRQVKQLRKQYHDTYLKHKQQDELELIQQTQEMTRRRLERQRQKNIRSAQNALRQEEYRKQAQISHEHHLQKQQVIRNKEKELSKKARKLVYDELEKEAPMWLTTSDEIENAFTHEAEQLLWTYPGGYIGVPNPTLDSHYWNYECHTWKMDKTYKTQRELLLQQIEEEAYNYANVDPEFWTEERLAERKQVEQKAKLRALVREEGRKELLRKQREYLVEDTKEQEIPKPAPVPSLSVLANVKAQEQEGSQLLFDDPTKFFIFDGTSSSDGSNNDGDDDNANTNESSYTGPSLGVPIGIHDPLRRTGSDRVFQEGIGKLPKPDKRTQKEKKRQEREQKLWAAAQQAARSEEADIDMAAIGDEEMGFEGEEIDYDKADDEWDEDDELWMKGLDPIKDERIINKPRELRYMKEDFDWVVTELQDKHKRLRSMVRNRFISAQNELKNKAERRAYEHANKLAEIEAAKKKGDEVIPSEEEMMDTEDDKEIQGPFLDDDTIQQLQALGADTDHYESLLSSLTDVQLVAVTSVDLEQRLDLVEKKMSQIASTAESAIVSELEDKEMIQALENIPGLSTDQITSLVQLQKLLSQCSTDEDSQS